MYRDRLEVRLNGVLRSSIPARLRAAALEYYPVFLIISLGGCCPAVVCLAYRTGAGGSVAIMPLACAARHQKKRLAMAFRWRSWLGLAVALFLLYGALNLLIAIAIP